MPSGDAPHSGEEEEKKYPAPKVEYITFKMNALPTYAV